MDDENDPWLIRRSDECDARVAKLMKDPLATEILSAKVDPEALIGLLRGAFMRGWGQGREALVDEFKAKVGK